MTNPNLNEPVDEIHSMSVRAIERIRDDIGEAKRRVAEWEPAPFEDWEVNRG